MIQSLLLVCVTATSVCLFAGLVYLQFFLLPARRAEALRQATLSSEAMLLEEIGRQIEQAQKVAETAVSAGTRVVRGVHSGIAAIPFSILEQLPSTREKARQVRVSHDLISNAVYNGIELLNREIHGGLRSVLDPKQADKATDLQEQERADKVQTSSKKRSQTGPTR